MHLLAAQRGSIEEAGEAIDLGQSPGDIVVISAADTDLSVLAAAQASLPTGAPTLRLANLMRLTHPMSVDTYVERTVRHAKLVVVRALGGVSYWSYGIEALQAAADRFGIRLALMSGDGKSDYELNVRSNINETELNALSAFLSEGGVENATLFLRHCAALIGEGPKPEAALPFPMAGVLDSARRDGEAGLAVIVFYRALVQSGQVSPVLALADALSEHGLAVTPVFVTSLRDSASAATLTTLFERKAPDVVLNLTGFAVSALNTGHETTVLDAPGVPVLQVVLSGLTEESWRNGTAGLSPKDIAMSVALPEVDGRVLTRAIAFKSADTFDDRVECDIVSHRPVPDRVAFVAEQAARWVRLARTPAARRKVAILLANYPNRDGRLANGVGLDTPAGTVEVLRAMKASGYRIDDCPSDGQALIDRLKSGVTNAGTDGRIVREQMTLADYRRLFATLPETVRSKIIERWGDVEADPFFLKESRVLALPFLRLGHVVVGIQPARGYNIDPKDSYHSPDLVPPHNYLAAYFWLRHGFEADAVIHMGKHGNLEWLPGKALALDETCFPEAVFGPVPHLYPFIVNDPGEGTQAKRRASAVIIDHLTPPMTRAETYGPLRDLEALVDDYYQAATGDPRRLKSIGRAIAELMEATGLDVDLGVAATDTETEKLERLDAHLCDLKELQIRNGLHVFGQTPELSLVNDLAVAVARVPRAGGTPGDASLHRALAEDLAVEFDPLTCAFEAPWSGPKPEVLAALSDEAWRTNGDTVERLEILALKLVSGEISLDASWSATAVVLEKIERSIKSSIIACGQAEIDALLRGLDGRFVPPGPSGAPTRGRAEVLPTGRNFYSVDTRAVPSEIAWELGRKSADLLVTRHLQDHGEWLRAVALTAWGTANMRTGGDDIAQALALIGVKPVWDGPSRRVTGFDILPVVQLGRPRVDVTLRVSGFFRDAFPDQMVLFDRATRAVARLDEPDEDNPLAARFKADRSALMAKDVSETDADIIAGHRVFGSRPGAYGAGLQALIDEGGWQHRSDFAESFLVWGSYAYGAGLEGESARGALETRLAQVDAVVQNQDNREHDLLDSDDYYQFEGGLAATVETLKGEAPTVYHNDHSRPERPVIRTLEQEIARVVRGRCVNPKWIAGVMRHGYKGAFEMAATLDYLFAFAATTGAVRDHHFEMVFDAYLADAEVRDFIGETNPDALREMAQRFDEAIRRGLWTPKSNSARFRIETLMRAKP